ncbi:MAG: phospholipase D-like domain-containing protein, partial [Bacteroidetes bacterium]|nr:phospholipase D-like domain-containing protein [Bacteroidota bacterium]
MVRPVSTAPWIILLLFPFSLSCQSIVSSDIEFVESAPVETTLDNPDIRNTVDVWTEMIRSARKQIDLEQFYLSPQQGEALDFVIGELIDVAARGVSVRIIIDARMYRTYPALADSFDAFDNITVRVLDFSKVSGGVQHAKYIIVDGEQVFVGSQNFDWRALTHIQELGLRIRHSGFAAVYRDLFELDWELAARPTDDTSIVPHNRYDDFIIVTPSADTVHLTPTYSPRGWISDSTRWDEPHVGSLIDQATSEVVLQFLSYASEGRDGSRYEGLEGPIVRAAARGVKVRMIVSDWGKGGRSEATLKQLSQIPNIEIRYVVIPEWSGGYISFARVVHCKFILVDQKAFWLGSSNGERSYFYTSRNVGVIVRNQRMAERLRRFFDKGW